MLNHLRKEIRNQPISEYLEDNWKTPFERFWHPFMAKRKANCELYFLINTLEGIDDTDLFQNILSIDFDVILKKLVSGRGFPLY